MKLIENLVIKFDGVDFNIKKIIKKGSDPIISVSFLVPENVTVPNYKNIKTGKNGKKYLNFYSTDEIKCVDCDRNEIDSDEIYPESTCNIVVDENNGYCDLIMVQMSQKGVSPFL